jgi:hypothetical protein
MQVMHKFVLVVVTDAQSCWTVVASTKLISADLSHTLHMAIQAAKLFCINCGNSSSQGGSYTLLCTK